MKPDDVNYICLQGKAVSSDDAGERRPAGSAGDGIPRMTGCHDSVGFDDYRGKSEERRQDYVSKGILMRVAVKHPAAYNAADIAWGDSG